MTFEEIVYEYLKDARTPEEMDEMVSELQSEISQAEDRIVTDNDWWED